MKAQISRDTFNEERQYSGVYQQQGRMITDADWNEMVRILKRRMDRTVGASIESGSPRHDGIIASPEATYEEFRGQPRFAWGRIYVDGMYGEIRPKPGIIVGRPRTMWQLLDLQRDFPANPADSLENGEAYTVYVDLWERLVVAQEDERLKDPALHGADTCVRTQTMAQVKLAKGEDFDVGDLPEHGDATLEAEVLDPGPGPRSHECDGAGRHPSAFAKTNALFRLEVHAVQKVDGVPHAVTLKWSSENGAEERRNGGELGSFLTRDHVYECFSTESETHLGDHQLEGVNGWESLKGTLYTYEDYHAARMERGSPAQARDRIRRWDGFLELERASSDGPWEVQPPHPDASVDPTAAGAQLTLSLKAGAAAFSVRLLLASADTGRPSRDGVDSAEATFLAGDYWLVLLRDSGTGLELRQLSTEPVGIRHHYLRLGTLRIVHGAVYVFDLTKAEWRRLSFPSLTQLTLDRVLVPDENGDESSVMDEIDKRVKKAGDQMSGPLEIEGHGGGPSMTLSASNGPTIELDPTDARLDLRGSLRVGEPIPGEDWGRESDLQQASDGLQDQGYLETPWLHTRFIETDQRGSDGAGIALGGKNGKTHDGEVGFVTGGELRARVGKDGGVRVGQKLPGEGWGGQSHLQRVSDGLKDQGYLETPWLHTRFIETDQRKPYASGIALGGKNGFTHDDEVGVVTRGRLRLKVDSWGNLHLSGKVIGGDNPMYLPVLEEFGETEVPLWLSVNLQASFYLERPTDINVYLVLHGLNIAPGQSAQVVALRSTMGVETTLALEPDLLILGPNDNDEAAVCTLEGESVEAGVHVVTVKLNKVYANYSGEINFSKARLLITTTEPGLA